MLTWYLPGDLAGSLVNQISTYRALAGEFSGKRTVPWAFDLLAAVDMESRSAESPTRTWTSAPVAEPSTKRTLFTVTAWPMSSSMPVPDCMWPNSAVAYHALSHAPPPWSTRDAILGLSPSDAPSGPNAVAFATVSVTAGPVGMADNDEDVVGDELADADGRVEDVVAVGDVAGDAETWLRNPVEIRS